ncbi:hypothetical protein CONCODRAFT_4509 [Conidiobolus coronatus NRRL 28638]|uniref:Uncharacterized protein n=1 Tax=Conidiobolus coronatus (strain ATCC 28846 / CBS 209.66 / NRRL 28638) TaxID=796925 RepID=A0A137PCB4_CONC2|nr:hypothetical protein CONCODRAFT_4509 [Conidiobolus coronatus NRRL 28638]|eukprot:KXN72647.1 hypothetical protein CONCODRAFT_4509 [Conidiobolus coronatus NRRL 28638]
MALTGGISGLLTVVAFLIDPAAWKAFQVAKLKVAKWIHGKSNSTKTIMIATQSL